MIDISKIDFNNLPRDLKSCPHCDEYEQELLEDDYDNYYVRCGFCGARSGECGNKKQAIIEWETRAGKVD